MSKQSDRDRECETTIQWDRTGDPATLWTADPSEAKRWTALGYPVDTDGLTGGGKACSWRCAVPVEAIALLPLKDGAVRISRYLSPPTVRVASGKGPGAPDGEKVSEIS